MKSSTLLKNTNLNIKCNLKGCDRMLKLTSKYIRKCRILGEVYNTKSELDTVIVEYCGNINQLRGYDLKKFQEMSDKIIKESKL